MPRCLAEVRETMEKWSRKSWSNMLVHQGEFEAEFNHCDERISNCLTMFSVSANGLKRACFEPCLGWRPNGRAGIPERGRKMEEEFPGRRRKVEEKSQRELGRRPCRRYETIFGCRLQATCHG